MQGFRGLYKGLPPTLLAATPFYATVFFGNNIGKRLQKQQPGKQLRYVGQSLQLSLQVEQVLHIIHAASCLLTFKQLYLLLSHACMCISSPITFCYQQQVAYIIHTILQMHTCPHNIELT